MGLSAEMKEKLYEMYPLEKLFNIIRDNKIESLYSILPKGMLSTPTSRTPMPPFLREEVLQRDNHCSTKCGSTDYLQIHHIIPYNKCKTHEYDNLATLCLQCHANHQKDWGSVYELADESIRREEERLAITLSLQPTCNNGKII